MTAGPLPACRPPSTGREPAAGRLWLDLGHSMRALRQAAGVSLRQAETLSGWRRGTLSQAEHGKNRPSRDLVSWYDTTLHGDGLLLALYAHARADQTPNHGSDRSATDRSAKAAGPAPIRVAAAHPPTGLLVPAGAELTARWRLVATGSEGWAGGTLTRVGAHAGAGLLASPRAVPVPPMPPGGGWLVECPLRVPDVSGTAVAFWRLTDSAGAIHAEPLLRAALVIDEPP